MTTTNELPYRVIIAGSRNFNNYNLLFEKCTNILKSHLQTRSITILSGGAKGADQLGEQFAQYYNLEIEYHKAEWHSYGKRAGLIRNAQMAENADALIAFWNGSSKGTENIIKCAYYNGLIVDVIQF